MHLLKVPWIILLLLWLGGCQTRKTQRQGQSTSIKAASPTVTSKPSTLKKQDAFYVVESEAPSLSSDQLLILKANIATTSLGGEKVGRLQFSTVQGVDYVAWQACPQLGETSCISGQGLFTEVFWGVFPPGPYTVVLHACQKRLFSESGAKGDICGPIYQLDWTQPPVGNTARSAAIERAYQIESQLKIYGQQLLQIWYQLSQDLKACKSESAASKDLASFEEVRQVLTIQLDNISHLGAGFVTYGLQGVTPPEAVSEMAAILNAGETPLGAGDDIPGYTPDGFSLTASQGDLLLETQKAHTVSYVDQSSVLTSAPVLESLKASSGPVKNSWEGLKDWQKGVSIMSTLLGGGILGKEATQDFATFHFISSLLNLREDTYPCDALNKAIAELTPIREHALVLKSQLKALSLSN